jgi:hypothetical protein
MQSRHEIDLRPHPDVAKFDKQDKVVMYQMNPTANWGPAPKAKNSKFKDPPVAKDVVAARKGKGKGKAPGQGPSEGSAMEENRTSDKLGVNAAGGEEPVTIGESAVEGDGTS